MATNVTSRKTSIAEPVVSDGGGSLHSYTEEEKVGFVDYINSRLANDKDLSHIIPINPDNLDIIPAVQGSILLNKLLSSLFPDKIDLRKIILNKKMNVFEQIQNHNYAIKASQAVGCKLVGIGAEDLRDGVVHLVFGVLWQIIKQGLLSKVNVTEHPELLELGLDAAEIERLSGAHPEQLLLKWVNYHLNNAGIERRMANFTDDVKDVELYVHLLNQLAPDECSTEILQKKESLDRANAFLEAADLVGCRKFVTPTDIVNGNYKLNMAFVANLFDRSALFERTAARARQERIAQAQAEAADAAARSAEAERRAKAAEEAAARAAEEASQREKLAAARAAEAEKRRLETERLAAERQKKFEEEAAKLQRQSSARAAELSAAAAQREKELQEQLAGLEDEKAKALRKQLAEREAIERQRDEEKALAESLKNEKQLLEEQLATLTKMFEDLSVRVTEAETQRDEAVADAKSQVEKTKAGARDWFAKQTDERKANEAKLTAATDAWKQKALEKEQLLKKYQAALKKARAERDEVKAKMVAAEKDLNAHQAAVLAEKDAQIEALKASAKEAQERHVAELEAVRNRAAGASNQDIELLKRQAMEALQTVQAQSASQLDAQRRHYEGQLQRIAAEAMQREQAALEAAQQSGSASDEVLLLRKRLKSLEKKLAALAPLAEKRQGYLIKYGDRNKTWNKRMFEQKRNVLVYYRDDGTLGGMLDMDGAEILHVHDIGKGSGTSKQTFGFNKPTAFEFVISTPNHKPMRVCANDPDDEEGWRRAIIENERAQHALNALVQEADHLRRRKK